MIHEASGWMIGRAIRIGAQAMAAARVETSVSGLENIPGGGPVLLLARHFRSRRGLSLSRSRPRSAWERGCPSFPLDFAIRRHGIGGRNCILARQAMLRIGVLDGR